MINVYPQKSRGFPPDEHTAVFEGGIFLSRTFRESKILFKLVKFLQKHLNFIFKILKTLNLIYK